MINIYIDNVEVDTDIDTQFKITAQVEYNQNLENMRNLTDQEISLPISENNMEIFNAAFEPNAVRSFNKKPHNIKIKKDNIILFNGEVILKKNYWTKNHNYGRFICIIQNPYMWLDDAYNKMFNEIPITLNKTYSAQTIKNSWTWEEPIRFLPVKRDWFTSQRCTTTMIPTAQIMPPENYHPFIHLKSAINAMVMSNGYLFESEFMNQNLFESLYISGNFKTSYAASAAIKNQQDFLAGRWKTTTTTANENGWVFTSSEINEHSLGTIAECADPKGVGPNGEIVEGVYNTNDCFKNENGIATFNPVIESTVAFEYNLSYTSDYKILNRTRLTGFDSVKIGLDCEFNYYIPNTFEDFKNNPIANMDYRLTVFNHNGGEYKLIVNNSSNQITNLIETKERSTHVRINSFANTDSIQLLFRPSPSYEYIPFYDDWALYPANATEYGQINIGLIIRSNYSTVKPSSYVILDSIIFKGAEPDMKISLGDKTTVRPIFIIQPGNNCEISFSDIANTQVRQSKIFEGIKHMFNLRFFTDTINNKIIAEPLDSFYSNYTVDWSDKIDSSKPIEIEELGLNLPAQERLTYADGDGTVARSNSKTQSIYGSWIGQRENINTKKQNKKVQNPLFTASLSSSEEFPSSENVTLIQAGDRDQHKEILTEDLNFPTKIVSYQGLIELPEGQAWGFPSYSREYPMVCFYNEDHNVSLRFDDTTAVKGLHKHYDKQFDIDNNSIRIILNIWLSPTDIQEAINNTRFGSGFKALYILNLNNETIKLRLEKIIDYDPINGGSTKCQFIKEINNYKYNEE